MGLFEKTVFVFLSAICIIALGLVMQKISDKFSVNVPANGGTLVEGIVGYPRYINPTLYVTDAGKDLTGLIYSGLLKANPGGTLSGDLAKSWYVSPDGLTYTVYIKDNAYFQDGTPVTASDIEFTIEKILDPELKSPEEANWVGVSVKLVNSKEVQFVLKKPYTPFIQNLTIGILPMHIWKDVDSEAFPFSKYNFQPIGSGPYEIKDIKTDSNGLPVYYRLVPFDKYVSRKPLISNIYIKFYDNETDLIKAYQNGDITSAASISPDDAKILSQNNARILTTPLPRVFALFFNQNQNAVLADKTVRQALNTAIDKEEIIKDVLNGYGAPIDGPLPFFAPNGEPDISGKETPEQDINEAKAMLEKEGWILDSNGVYELKNKKTTTPLSFTITTSDVPELQEVATKLQETWQKMGAKVDVQIYKQSDLEENVIAPRKYDALLFGEAVDRGEDLYAFWDSSERNYPGLNVAMYANSDVDKLLEEALTAPKANQESLYQEIDSEIEADVPAVFIYSPDFIYVVPQNLQGIDLQGIAEPSERFLSIDSWYLETDKIWKIFASKK